MTRLVNAIFLGVGATVGFGVSLPPGIQSQDVARYRDAEGRTRCRIGELPRGGGHGIQLLNVKGHVVCSMRVSESGVAVTLDGGSQGGGIRLMSDSEGSTLSLGVGAGPGLLMSRENSGTVSVSGFNSTGECFRLSSSDQIGSRLELFAPSEGGGGPGCVLAVTPEGCDLRMSIEGHDALRIATTRGQGSLVSLGSEGRGVQMQSLVGGDSSVLLSAGVGAPSIVIQSSPSEDSGLYVLDDQGESVLKIGVSKLGDVIDTWAKKKIRGANK